MAGTFEIRDTVLERSCLALHGRTYLMGEREALTHSTLGTIRHGVPESRLNSSGGGGRNRTGVHVFAGLRWIVLDQRPSPDSLSPKRQLSLFGAVVLLGFLRGGESSFPAQLLPVKGRPHVEQSARDPIMRAEANRYRDNRVEAMLAATKSFVQGQARRRSGGRG